MLGLAEYRIAAADLQQLAQSYDNKIADATEGLHKRPAVSATKDLLNTYYDEYEELLERAAIESADNAVNYYSRQLDVEVPTGLAQDIVDKHWKESYYGATVAWRLIFNRNRLIRTADRTAAVGIDHLSGILTQRVPFGAQSSIERRLLLGTMIKIEQDVAKHVANLADVPLIRWTLSHRHAVPDICDDLATHVDKDVEKYLEEREMHDVDAKGLYFANSLPAPPHPNCQCEYGMVAPGRPIGQSAFRRTLTRMRRLFNRFRKR